MNQRPYPCDLTPPPCQNRTNSKQSATKGMTMIKQKPRKPAGAIILPCKWRVSISLVFKRCKAERGFSSRKVGCPTGHGQLLAGRWRKLAYSQMPDDNGPKAPSAKTFARGFEGFCSEYRGCNKLMVNL